MNETKALRKEDTREGEMFMDMSDHYSFYGKCSNCPLNIVLLWVRKGYLIDEAKCPNCGCKTLSKKS
jgi:rubrerythrin